MIQRVNQGCYELDSFIIYLLLRFIRLALGMENALQISSLHAEMYENPH